MEHNLKIRFEYAIDVMENGKNFEVRKNDRNYQKGDTIKFTIVNDFGNKVLTNFEMPIYKITYVFYGGEYGVDEDYCVFGIEPIKVQKMKIGLIDVDNWQRLDDCEGYYDKG